jgi:hypothetical protein
MNVATSKTDIAKNVYLIFGGVSARIRNGMFRAEGSSSFHAAIGWLGLRWLCNRPSEVRQGAIVYSLGVGEEISWDLAPNQRYGVTIHAFELTSKAKSWLGSLELAWTMG